jgi:hypothetical protein
VDLLRDGAAVFAPRLDWVRPRPQCETCNLGEHKTKGHNVATRGKVEIRVGAPGNVLEIQAGRVEVDVPRSVGYFGGLAAAVGLGLLEPPLALFIAAVPAFKVLTNSALPRAVRVVGEVLEGAAKPVGSDAEGVVLLQDQAISDTDVVALPSQPKRRATPRTSQARRGQRAK